VLEIVSDHRGDTYRSVYTVRGHADNYEYEVRDGHVVACVERKKVQWYQWEICHLSVREEWEHKGAAFAVYNRAQAAARSGRGSVLQCTIRYPSRATVESACGHRVHAVEDRECRLRVRHEYATRHNRGGVGLATLRFSCPSGATDGAETDAKRAIPSVEVVFEGEENNRMVGCRESGGARRSAANSHHLLHARR
jgi:uncharacterized protein YxjI